MSFMFRGLIMACILAWGAVAPGHKVWCKLSSGRVVRVQSRVCLRLGGEVVRPGQGPKVTPTPTVVPTATPAPTPALAPVIERVEVFDGTSGESTFGYVTGVKAWGEHIGTEARMKLTAGGEEYLGMYQGGDGETWILTDFLGLPHCQTYNVVVSGDNGVGEYPAGVDTVCP